MQRLVDNVLAVTKESIKTFTYESLSSFARLINGFSALLLAFLPGKASILEGIHGWELRPTIRGPRFPRWMENGVSSFNKFVCQLAVDSDTSSTAEFSSGEDDSDRETYSSSPSHSPRAARAMRFTKGSKAPTAQGCHPATSLHYFKKEQLPKDHVVRRATDKRRGVIEDLHLAVEIFIEAIFDAVHKAAHLLLSPIEAFEMAFGWFSSDSSGDASVDSDATVSTATLGEDNPTPTERKTTSRQSMNTDARTCQDVITELGYPYEAIRVVTSDGYVLLLERIPRRDSRKVVYLQHGILDSSMGWVSNGVVGSPAFAAFDQGYDVFLGNLRGLVSREHVEKNISSRKYWCYSVNEHGTKDLPALFEKIHEIKTSELKCDQPDGVEDSNDGQPYKVCAVCHSLGGAAMLMYVITCRIEEKPHRLSRLVLLSPAGFHEDSNSVFNFLEALFLLLAPILEPFIPGFYIPTRFFRMLLNKLARDFHYYPAVGGLVQTLVSYFVGGDSSNWVGVIGLPHYNMDDMPGLSFRVAHHLAQMKRARKFLMFNYGDAQANMEVYGSPEPLDLGKHYGLIDVPVDLVGGCKDQVIRSSMIRKHYKLMKEQGVEVSYSEFEYAHLDFTFSHSEELLTYVVSRLLLVGSTPMKQQVCSEDSKIVKLE